MRIRWAKGSPTLPLPPKKSLCLLPPRFDRSSYLLFDQIDVQSCLCCGYINSCSIYWHTEAFSSSYFLRRALSNCVVHHAYYLIPCGLCIWQVFLGICECQPSNVTLLLTHTRPVPWSTHVSVTLYFLEFHLWALGMPLQYLHWGIWFSKPVCFLIILGLERSYHTLCLLFL